MTYPSNTSTYDASARPSNRRRHDRPRPAGGHPGAPAVPFVKRAGVPAQDTTPVPAVDVSAFAALGLEPALLKSIARLGYERPTPIQEQAIPHVLAGSDVVGCAQTGTGKTAAFVLPILQHMLSGTPRPNVQGRPGCAPTALVVTPTRELAGQIEEVGTTMAKNTRFRVLAVYGGVPYFAQTQRALRGVDLLVATPGRLLDMMRQGHASLANVKTLVLDEADRMLDMGFWPDVQRIINAMPADRQNLFFSATMSRGVLSVIEETLSEPVFLDLAPTATPVDTVEQSVLPVANEQKNDLLLQYFRHHDPACTLVFTRTRHRADRLARTLNREGVACAAIHGDRTQGQRQRALDSFKSRSIKVLVATDVVARGIDVEGITHVVNFDIPTVPEDYVHRIGRTARAGASGTAVSLLTAEDVGQLTAIERLIGSKLDRRDLPGFDYARRAIPAFAASPVAAGNRAGKQSWNGGARRATASGARHHARGRANG